MKRFLIALFALSIGTVPAKELPVLKPVGDKWLLHVDGAPFPILGGHVMNSSSFDPEWMETAFDRLKAFHANTLFAPISWQAVEPEEGKFDFSLVDSLVKQARARDMRLIILWFGTWKNARSFYVPEWVKTDMDRFKRMEDKDGGRLEVMSNLCEETNAADTRAYVEFMRHLKKIDGAENTVIMVQIQNEVGLLGDTRDRSAPAQDAFAGQVPAELMEYLCETRSGSRHT
jgi:beta-galactosidase GanA